MKKTLSLLAVILVLVFAVSCGSGKKDNKDTTDTEPADDTDVTDTDTGNETDTDSDTTPDDTDSDNPDTTPDDGDTSPDHDTDTDTDTDDDDETSDDDTDTDTEEPVKKHELIGKYTDSWGGSHIISNTVWFDGYSLYNITQFDNENDFIIAQNDKKNGYNPEKWSRFDYTEKEGKLYYCQTAFNAESEEAALNTPAADKTDPATTGCGGTNPWTELVEVVEEGIGKDDEKIVAWATGYKDYNVGENVIDKWQTPEKALGKAVGDSYDVVVLGDGGSITLTFDRPIINGEGADFAVFENSFNDTFLEIGTVEVSSDGEHFVAFDNYYLGTEKIGSTGGHDARLIWGFAGKFKQGVGNMFDLADLAGKPEVADGTLNLNAISYVKIVDVIGDGSQLDSIGDPVYDPYPTSGSAGFDLDAIAVINEMAKEDFEIEIAGKYKEESYGSVTGHTISNSDWIMESSYGKSVFHFTKYDKDNDFMIAYNAGSNPWNPGLWSRFDYTEKDGELYYCQTAYNAVSEAAALATPAADKTDPANSGCGTYNSPWSKLVENLEITGKWYAYQYGQYDTISEKVYYQFSVTYGLDYGYESIYNIVEYDNETDTFIALKSGGTYNTYDNTYSKINWILEKENGKEILYICEIAYGNETIEDAKAAADADKTDPAHSGCGTSNWNIYVRAGTTSTDNKEDMHAEREEAANADDDYIDVWASNHGSFEPGEGADEEHNNTDDVTGEADGKYLSLGKGGSVIVKFDEPIPLEGGEQGEEIGSDFIVFGNVNNHALAKVEVSSNGTTFIAFDTYFTGNGLGESEIFGFAGKFDEGKGTKFDLSDLALKPEVKAGTVDLEEIKFIRITDIPGDGSVLDSQGNPIFYPYPETGFELDAVATVVVE